MGKRLHSAIKYEVKYETNGRFNWGGDHVNPIIECLAEGDFWCDDYEYMGGANTLEANRENLLANVERIINPDPEWVNQEELNDLLKEMENDKEWGMDTHYLYTELKMLIEQSDPNCAYVHFAWF